jgi:protein-tyrosine-phosphatase
MPIGSVVFVCKWNEGRSAHLELSTRKKLKEMGSYIRVMSTGFNRGDSINPLRRRFLMMAGIPQEEIDAHKPAIFGPDHAKADLILVAELPMKEKLLAEWPELGGKVMTVKGFVKGFSPEDESLTEEETRIEDSYGHTDEGKLLLYEELEELAGKVSQRLSKMIGA